VRSRADYPKNPSDFAEPVADSPKPHADLPKNRRFLAGPSRDLEERSPSSRAVGGAVEEKCLEPGKTAGLGS
jgi:hypothetical protein